MKSLLTVVLLAVAFVCFSPVANARTVGVQKHHKHHKHHHAHHTHFHSSQHSPA